MIGLVSTTFRNFSTPGSNCFFPLLVLLPVLLPYIRSNSENTLAGSFFTYRELLKDRLEEIYHKEESQKLYKLRKEKAELPFGHMKRNLGAGQFLLRGKEGVNAELSILSTCFNMARQITILGVPMLIAKFNSM
jgi:hypothetical protein